MTERRVPIRALDAALDIPRPVDRIGNCLFLYLALIRHAGSHGAVIRTRTRLSQELGVAEDRIDRWLSRLVDAGLVRVQSPLPYLVAHFVSWSGEVASQHENPSNSCALPESHIEDSYSNSCSKQLSGKQAIAIGDGGAGEGVLARLAREVVGPEVETELPAILARHSPDHVARALNRVRNTPPEKIRKSKLALFRYLIAKTDRHP
jgi:hypothetical protein